MANRDSSPERSEGHKVPYDVHEERRTIGEKRLFDCGYLNITSSMVLRTDPEAAVITVGLKDDARAALIVEFDATVTPTQ